ncbi:IS701 family transposase [Streptomyces boluensis]|uniref:IS701 family transposase n=1 Tax=Streptomyces boluensis TaxID=1775135 RepID=A0A964URY8_9ACTN|nr:IS701 family transposase [Streptomyces boluensis]NBE51902.1 IS701 family transposase [Streptomyces boluensis]
MATRDLTRSQVSVSMFIERVFGHLPRTDQRYWAQAYLTGLLSAEGKKSVRRLAAAVSDSPTASQSMHQFVNASPWDWAPARAELMRWTEERLAPKAWTLDVAVMRKRGEHSCGVHRRFVPSTGRSVNCQVGVGAFLTSESEAIPVDWGLLLPGSWVNDEQRRSRARIPGGVDTRAIDQHALDLVDTLSSSTGSGDLPVVADLTAYAGASALVRGLSRHGRGFVVAVPGRMPVVPGGHLTARTALNGELPAPVEAQRFFELKQNSQLRLDTSAVRDGRPGQASVLTGLVRLPETRVNRAVPHRTYRLFAVRHSAGRRSTQLWLTNMAHRRTDELFALTQLRRRARATVQALENEYGLLDFEGRSYPGWHHHMTLVSAAYAYGRAERSGGLGFPG